MPATPRTLIGRDEELAAIDAFLDDGLAPGVVALHGEAGIGKTILWSAGTAAAAAHGCRILSTRPSEAETTFAYAGLADILGDSAGDVLPELPPIQRRALEAALLLGDSEPRADDRAVAAAFLGAVRLLADGGRVCIAVDDLQWLDAASLAPLRYALARLEDEPIVALLAIRGAIPTWLPRALAERRFRAIDVRGLSLGATHQLLRTRLEGTFPRPTLIRLWETSRGNPFFALELASALQRRGGTLALGEELPIPSSLDQLLRDRIGALSATARDVARAAAALAEPTVVVLETALGAEFDAGLAAALEARILELDGEHVRFTHPLLASAVAAGQTPARRRSLHARLAAVVPSTEERARHLALASNRPNRVTAAVIEEAARTAQMRGAPGASAELARQALELTPLADLDDRDRRLLYAAERYLEAGDPGRATELLEPALELAPTGPARAAVLVSLANVRAAFGTPREAIALYTDALVHAAGDDRLAASIHLSLAPIVADMSNRAQALAHASEAVRLSSPGGDDALRCKALSSYVFSHFSSGRGIPDDELADALALERSLPEWPLARAATYDHAFVLIWSGQLDRARTIAHELREALRSRGDPEEAWALWLLTMVEWRAGHWPRATEHAAAAADVRDQAGMEGLWPVAHLPGALVAAYRGNVDDARRTSERALAGAEAAGIRIAQSGHRCVLGFIELSRGDAGGALSYLIPAWQIRDEVQLLEPGHRLELADTLEALVAVGELDQAEAWIVEWERRSRLLDRAWALAILARCRGLVLAARGDLEGAIRSFEGALAEHGRAIDPFQHARTLLALGRTQRRGKKRGAARATLQDALQRFETVGAPLWADRARAELARIGGRAASRDDLTEAEARIAALVAEGRTNREVAAALFLTERSVETALTRIYRKIGVRSRSELAHVRASNT